MIATGPVASQVAQPAYVGEEAVSGNARGKSTSSSAPIPALQGPQSASGRLSRSNSRSNTADFGPLYQASASNVPASLLPRPRVNDNIFSGLSSGSANDGEYCTWLSKNNLALYWAHHYTNYLTLALSQALSSTLHFIALQVRDGGPTGQPVTLLCMKGSRRLFARRHSISRRLNRPISISLSCLCHLVLSVMACSTRPCRLTHVELHLTAFYTAMEMLNGELPRRLDQRIAQHSNWIASFQSLPMIHLLACLVCALRAATKR